MFDDQAQRSQYLQCLQRLFVGRMVPQACRPSQANPTPRFNPPVFHGHAATGSIPFHARTDPVPAGDGATSHGTAMLDRIAKHEQSVHTLQSTVNLLLEERDRSRLETAELKEQLHGLSNRLAEKGVDMTTEQKLMAWKRDVDQNLYSLTDQVQIHSNHNQSTTASALAISALADELRSTKASYVFETSANPQSPPPRPSSRVHPT
eukprot:m.151531 g.151531  ORF g.151531 m.151531 type:complete len:206 (+) comp23351_c0_seq8:140-757(+)